MKSLHFLSLSLSLCLVSQAAARPSISDSNAHANRARIRARWHRKSSSSTPAYSASAVSRDPLEAAVSLSSSSSQTDSTSSAVSSTASSGSSTASGTAAATSTATSTTSGAAAASSSASVPTSNMSFTESTLVQMFEWPWASIASECEFLGSAGYNYIQISPPYEHVVSDSWASSYAPVSYNLTSKRGDRTALASMISTCADAGVGVIADAVFNHMSSYDQGTGSAGNTFSRYDYPVFKSDNFHYCNGDGTAMDISNYDNATEVQYCELEDLPDLAQEQTFVSDTIKAYLNDLIDLGVVGFRVDAAKHINLEYLQPILGGLKNTSELLITQEIAATDTDAPDALKPSTYATIGMVHNFPAAYDLYSLFAKTGSAGIKNLADTTIWGASYLPSSQANYFVTNHDTERNGGTLNWQSSNNAYVLANVFALGFDYGLPTVFSGYNWTDSMAAAPQDSDSVTDQVTCGESGWRCEHRWTAFANMATLRKKAAGIAVDNVQSGTDHQVAFGRGDAGFVAINNDDSAWSDTFTTSLPAGDYCDVIAESDITSCSTTYTVASDGTVELAVPAYNAVALTSA